MQRLQTIDWLEDVLNPEIEALKAGKPVLGLNAGTAFDIVVEEEPLNIFDQFDANTADMRSEDDETPDSTKDRGNP